MNGVSKTGRYLGIGPGLLPALVLAVVSMLSGFTALADGDETITGNFVVSFSAEGGQRPWIVKALEQNIYNDLSGYARVVAVEKAYDERKLCPRQRTRCILDLYASRDIDALMIGRVNRSRVEFEVYDVRNRYLVNTGSLKIGNNASLLKLRLGAFKAFKVFIESGGILDDRVTSVADAVAGEPLAPTTADEAAVVESESLLPATAEFRRQVLMTLAGIVCLPLFFATFGRPFRHPDRSRLLLHWCYPYMLVSLALLGLQFWMENNGGGNIVNGFLNLFSESYWILAGIGGAIWGSFLIVNFKLIVPHLTGIERIEKENLLKLLRSCLVTMLIKSLLVTLFYVALFFFVWQMGKVFGYTTEAAVLLVFPVAGLFVFYWIALMLDVFAMSNDVKLSGKRFVFNSEWNLKIRKYFTAYLKRNGITLDSRLVDNVAFIPGQHQGVVSYRGGFGRPRIAIEKNLLIFALGDIDESDPGEEIEEYYEEREQPELRQHGIFRILPGALDDSKRGGFFRGRADKRRAAKMQATQKRLQRSFGSNRRNRGAVNGSALSSGVVMPLVGDAVPALLSNGPKDVHVLNNLFREYAMRHQQEVEAPEVDDSSEFDRDFLFGALLHQFGSMLRHDTIWSTSRIYFSRKKKVRESRYRYPFSRHFAVIADTFVVLNFGLNHLIQYLFYRATKDPMFLTSKGMPGRMLENQAQILANAKEMLKQRKSSLLKTGTDELDRIAWLSCFSQEAIHRNPKSVKRHRRLVAASLTTITASICVLLIVQAYDYHPTYLDIIETEQQKIDAAIEAQRENERKKANE